MVSTIRLDLLISIHALREEGDAYSSRPDTPPNGISIHALREEGDLNSCKRKTARKSISIHALREEGDQRPSGRGL